VKKKQENHVARSGAAAGAPAQPAASRGDLPPADGQQSHHPRLHGAAAASPEPGLQFAGCGQGDASSAAKVSFAAAVPQDAEGLRRPGGPLRGCARAYCFGGAAEEAVSSIFGLRLTVYGLPMTGSNTAKCDGDAACHTNQITAKQMRKMAKRAKLRGASARRSSRQEQKNNL